MTPTRLADIVRLALAERWRARPGVIAAGAAIVLVPPPLVLALSADGATVRAWWSLQEYWLVLLGCATLALSPWAVVAGARHRGWIVGTGLLVSWRLLSHFFPGPPVLLAVALTALWVGRVTAMRPASTTPE